MPRIPLLSGLEMIKFLSSYGAIVLRSKWSHRSLVRETAKKKHIIIVPDHKQLKLGTTKSILRQAWLSDQDLIDYAHGV